ncbi:MAG: hypothetical protein AAGJ35_11575, partial [Myxococcota bacterium]
HPLGQGNVTFSTQTKDYRWFRIDAKKKVRLPMLLESYIGGKKQSTLRFKKLVVNASRVKKQWFWIPSTVK